MEEMILQQDRSNQVIVFRDVSGEKGITKDGVPYSSHLYQSSYGIGLSVTREHRSSHIRANKELQRKLKKAIKIVERGIKINEKGQRVGERVVALFSPNGSEKEEAVVLWTNGSHLYYIESSSLQHVLEFEKRFYH